MLIGLCSSAVAAPDAIAASGIDFLEENVQSFLSPETPLADFMSRLAIAQSCRKPLAAANCFLPADLKCVGPDVNLQRLMAWGSEAFARAKRAGIGIIVFGSGAARALPPGTLEATAHAQFITLLRALGPLAKAQEVVLAVEPLNRGECNFITTIAEGAALVRDVGHPQIRLLVDIFHMMRNGETPEDMRTAKGLVVHAHVAELAERTAPGTIGDDLRPYLRALRAMGYDGRLSMECRWTDCFTQLPMALHALRQQVTDAGYACA